MRIALHRGLDQVDNPSIGWSSRFVPKAVAPEFATRSCIEIDIESHSLPLEEARAALESSLFSAFVHRLWLAVIGDEIAPRNRVRSHKGLFWGWDQIRENELFEMELEREGGTLLLGLMPITPKNRIECFALAQNPLRSVVLVHREPPPNPTEMLLIINTCVDMNTQGSTVLNPLSLATRAVVPGIMAAHVRGGVQWDFCNLVIFVHESDQDWAVRALEDLGSESAF